MNIPLTITETQEGLLKESYTAVQLIDSYLARIKKFDKQINSFITVCEDFAYQQAKKCDQLIDQLGNKALDKHPLLGTVVAHKDLYLTKGIRTTAASNVLKDYVPTYSATVVKRLEEAGAICIGKTNCDAWAHGGSGENSDFGPTKNPWDLTCVPGGSSSGSGAATAANFTNIATGTDTGGSIRCPANFCGVYGLKPTYGSVSRYGVVAMASSLDSMGHFARCIDDIEKVYSITKGEDGKDSTLKNVNGQWPAVKGRKLKIGIPKEYFAGGLNKEVENAAFSAAKVFEKEELELVNISLPHTKYAVSVYYIIQPAEVSSNLSRYDGIRYGAKRTDFGDEAKRRIMLGTYVLSAGYYDAFYLKAMKVRSKIIEDFDKAYEKVDAIISPVMPTPAFMLGEKTSDPLKMYLADIFTTAANLAGIPAISIPSGFSQKKLPLGFQLMGQKFSEPLLFKLGKLYEQSTNWKPTVAKLV